MTEATEPRWLVIDGYEDEPAAFGVPPYIGFHVRYVCGVLETHRLPYLYLTVDQWRRMERQQPDEVANVLKHALGVVCVAGAVVPGKYLRGTPISLNETQQLLRSAPSGLPVLMGGWAIRGGANRGGSRFDLTCFLPFKTPTPRWTVS